MIDNGLGVGVMPRRAFELLHGAGKLVSIGLRDAWSERRLDLVARDFSALPHAARQLVDHLLGRESRQPVDHPPERAPRQLPDDLPGPVPPSSI